MHVIVNGEPIESEAGISLEELAETALSVDRMVAIAVNGAVVPRSIWSQHRLRDNDRIEIVEAIQGG